MSADTKSRTPSLFKRLRRKGETAPEQPDHQHKAGEPAWYAGMQAYMHQPSQAVWSNRDYRKFAEEAYRRNVVANRAIGMIASGVASLPIHAHETQPDGQPRRLTSHPVLKLMERPSPRQSRALFFEALVSYYLLSGDSYVQAVGASGEPPRELHLLRPDRVQILAGKHGIPKGYRYTVDQQETTFRVDPITGASRILHLRHFHPMSDWHGLAPAEAAAYSIDQHNQAASWNQSLLQNGARPSGALVMQMSDSGGRLSEDQYWRLKQQIDEQFTGTGNSGRPLLLEGGLDWKEMSLSPKDMDFLEMKHSAARDIALAFGVPPQLLGIPGDNTYSNLAEARQSLWEQTILPLANMVLDELTGWLNPMFGGAVQFTIDRNAIPALSPKRETLWDQIAAADFLSDEEKRRLLGV